MSDIVFILGAGASKQAGAPLMAEFLDVADNLWKLKRVQDAASEFEKVSRGKSTLQYVHSKAQLDIQNLEAVFTAFEMAKTLGRFSSYSLAEIESLIVAMRIVIARTIEETLLFPVDHSGPRLIPPLPYSPFAALVNALTKTASPQQSVAILTFNYDVGVDCGLTFQNVPFDYALGKNTQMDSLPLLKLHGSLNWGQCHTCQEIVPYPTAMPPYRINIGSPPSPPTFRVTEHLKSQQHCERSLRAEPFIVPPTWNKVGHYQTIAPVWERAAQELSGAESIFIIGFSLPPSDAFFSYLYALGTVGSVPLKRFWVFNPDNSGEVEKRFRNLLGPGASQRFGYFPLTFIEAVAQLQEVFQV